MRLPRSQPAKLNGPVPIGWRASGSDSGRDAADDVLGEDRHVAQRAQHEIRRALEHEAHGAFGDQLDRRDVGEQRAQRRRRRCPCAAAARWSPARPARRTRGCRASARRCGRAPPAASRRRRRPSSRPARADSCRRCSRATSRTRAPTSPAAPKLRRRRAASDSAARRPGARAASRRVAAAAEPRRGAGSVPAGGGGGPGGRELGRSRRCARLVARSSCRAGTGRAAAARRMSTSHEDQTAAGDSRACRTKTTVLFRVSRIARRERFSMKRLPTVYHLCSPWQWRCSRQAACARLRARNGAAPHQGRSSAAAELQHPERAGEISDRRDVDLRAAQAA